MVRARGLTLIEVLIVLIVLALLAAIVTPQFTRADTDGRLSVLKANLLEVRAQIRLYRTQHGDRYPDLDPFVQQLTACSTPDGSPGAGDGQHGLGPYLRAIPPNPYTGGATVGNGPIGTSDWHYDPATGLFRANHDPAFISY